jgi:hypothetical protein
VFSGPVLGPVFNGPSINPCVEWFFYYLYLHVPCVRMMEGGNLKTWRRGILQCHDIHPEFS